MSNPADGESIPEHRNLLRIDTKNGTKLCLDELSGVDRRRLLAAIGGAGTASIAGCVGLAAPAPKRAPSHLPEGPVETHDVEFTKQGQTLQIDADEFLLKAGEEAGMELPFWCRSGICGVCLARVDGDTHDLVHMTNNEFEPLDDEAMSEGYTLTCTGQPRDDFAIETGMTGALQPTPTPTATPEEGATPIPDNPLPGQRLVFAEEVTIDGSTYAEDDVVTADAFSAPHGARVLPEDGRKEDNTILLHELEPNKLEEPTNMDMIDGGFVAYSAICTHLRCTSQWVERDVPEVFCACHNGHYDPYRGAVVTGGPPPRPLPQIGVKVNSDGELELTTEFEGPVGPL